MTTKLTTKLTATKLTKRRLLEMRVFIQKRYDEHMGWLQYQSKIFEVGGHISVIIEMEKVLGWLDEHLAKYCQSDGCVNTTYKDTLCPQCTYVRREA